MPFRDAAQVCEQEVSHVLTDISLDKEMYNVVASLDGARLDAAGTYYLRTTLRDYHRAGVDRDDPTRDKIRKLQDELVKIGQQFDENIAGDVRKLQVNASDLDGLPDDFKRSHPPDASGKVTLSTDNTDYFPFMDYSKSESARKAFFVLYRQRAYPKNIDVLGQLLQKRHELANVLGYPDWAAYITEDKMVGTEQNAADFIEKISVAAQPGAKRDYEELLAYKKQEDPKAESVNGWDVSHLVRGAKIEKFGYDSQVMRPYFEYSRVLQGILDITSRMYGITYKPVTSAQVWHPEVTVYDVFDKGNRIGRIYFDMFPRENKYKHYATFTLATGKEGFRLPEYVLVCNFPKATDGPGLMERDDVITFFHEYGHLVHGIMRGNTKWAVGDLENDFIEAPSQMFEEWPQDPAILKTFARHYKTNEPIPAELAEKAKAADKFGRALDVRTQMFYAAISLDFYNRDPQGPRYRQTGVPVTGKVHAVPVCRGHPHADRLRPPQRLLRDLLHLHVVAGHRQRHVYRVHKRRFAQSPGRREVPRLGSRCQRHQTRGRNGTRLSGTPVFVPRVCELAERQIAEPQPAISRIHPDKAKEKKSPV